MLWRRYWTRSRGRDDKNRCLQCYIVTKLKRHSIGVVRCNNLFNKLVRVLTDHFNPSAQIKNRWVESVTFSSVLTVGNRLPLVRNCQCPSTMDPPTNKRRRGETKPLPTNGLSAALDSAIASQGSAELAVIYLMDKYDFDLDELKARIEGA